MVGPLLSPWSSHVPPDHHQRQRPGRDRSVFAGCACRQHRVLLRPDPLDPATGDIVGAGDIEAQARRAFDNLKAVAEEAGGSLDQIVRLGLYLTDLAEFAKVNAVMQDYFKAPFPARSTIEVSGLPKGANFEVDAVMVLDQA